MKFSIETSSRLNWLCSWWRILLTALVVSFANIGWPSQRIYAQNEAPNSTTLTEAERETKLMHRDEQWAAAQKAKNSGDFKVAIKAGEATLEIEQLLLGVDHSELISTFKFLADCEAGRQNWEASKAIRTEVLTRSIKAFGEKDYRVADARQALKHLGIVDRLTAEKRDQLTDADAHDTRISRFYREANYPAAIELANEALVIREKILGPEHPDTALSLNNLALLYDSQANYPAAVPLYQRALKINEKILGPEHPDTASSLNNLAGLYDSQANYAAAKPLYQRALKINEKVLGPEHPATALSLNNLAELYVSQANHAMAEPLYQRALKINVKILGAEHPATATSLNNLAGLYNSQANYAAAEPLYQRALKINEKILGPEHPDTALSLNNLAGLYNSQANYALAEQLYQRALEIKEKALGPEHPATATSLNNLAALYQVQGSYAAAEPLYQRALSISEKALGPEHPDTANSLNNLGVFQWGHMDERQAVGLAARTIESVRTHLELTATIQSEWQQLLMAKENVVTHDFWLTVTSPDANGSDSWNHALPWKGITTSRQALLRRVLGHDPLFSEYHRVTQQLSNATLSPPRPPVNPEAIPAWKLREPELRRLWEAEKERLEIAHADLEKQLATKWAAFDQDQRRQRVTAKEIAAALQTQQRPTAFVDLNIYLFFGRDARDGREKEPDEYRLAAFIARPDREVQRVELGASVPLLQLIDTWTRFFGQGDEGRVAGEQLRERLWQPLEEKLDGIETVLISPDGALAQLPWGALPGAKPESYLLEELSIALIPIPQYLPEIMEKPLSNTMPSSLLLTGDIDYYGDPGQPQKSLAEDSPREFAARNTRAMQFPKIAAAQPEIASIKERYERALKKSEQTGSVESLYEADATENAFCEKAEQFAWLHVVTHGYFAPESIQSILQQFPTDEKRDALSGPSTTPTLAGIGAGLDVQNDICVVSSIVTAGAAQLDGRLQVGDQILAVETGENDWVKTAGKTLDEIIPLIRGPAGTDVRLKVRHNNQKDGETELELTRRGVPSIATGKPIPVHPGLLSGLAFAGANQEPQLGKDDGILSAMDVTGLNLQKVDTVVLSACETGLGQVAGGEGLLGLQRAFLVAGANTTVASLWKVHDAATARLMQRFYENLWDKKMGKLAALREAQIWMLRDQGNRGLTVPAQPADKASLPPYYWAAFVLSGDWR